MTDFNRILTDIQTSEAEAVAGAAIETATQQAQRTAKMRYARGRFNDVGVGAYLQEQVAAMQAAHYWAKFYDNDLDDRVQTSIEFVPAPHVSYEKRIGGPNTVTLHIVADSDAMVKAELYSGHYHNTERLVGTTLGALSLANVQFWFKRYVQYALAFQTTREDAQATFRGR
ncbi:MULTISPECIES: hypothetical protein [Cupriavidus]